MNSIRIQNLRSLKDTGEMKIKPINILVGGNSSGKSTFLRLFPLMKQSLGKKINGPILWAGEDDDYVDFGSFKEALCTNSDDKYIKFAFYFDNTFKNYISKNENENENENENVEIEFSLEKNEKQGFDYVSEIKISIYKKQIIIKINEKKHIEKICVDDSIYTINKSDKPSNLFFGDEQFLFGISMRTLLEYSQEKIFKLLKSVMDESLYERYERYDPDMNFQMLLNDLCNENINCTEEKQSRKNNSKNNSKNEFIYANEIFKIQENLKNNNLNLKFNDYVLIYCIPLIYKDISRYLLDYFSNVYYIAPVRATAERYYRLRNTAVNEVDCRGKNLAIFLNSLSEVQLFDFREWTMDNLDFSVELSLSEGHVSIQIKKKGSNEKINLSDTGFGYSQILPIITQLWYIAINGGVKYRSNIFRSYRNNVPATIVIEQPELHLHPGLQAKLVDVIVKVMKNSDSKKNSKKVQFVIETHSETIINRFGNLIYKDKLSQEDIAISIFEKEIGESITKIQFGKFDEDGYLENWPVGFFDPEEVL